jgi:putative transposase
MTFNNSIGIMLRSYTRAINIQEGRSGALFREGTKAICVTRPVTNPPSWYLSDGQTVFLSFQNEKQYANNCFNYIIKNPLKDGLVNKLSKWEFTSYHELKGKEDIINRKRIDEFGLCLL